MADRFLTGEPYRLLGNRIPFTGWHYVSPTCFNWVDENGECCSVRGDQDPWGADYVPVRNTWGVKLAVKPAVRSGRILSPEMPWEDGNESITCIIQQDGVCRAWGSVGGWGDLNSRGKTYFCYWESVDGYNWTRPPVGSLDYEGRTDTNLLGNSVGTVFYDPHGPESERYKWVSEHFFTPEECRNYLETRPEDVDSRTYRSDIGKYLGMRGAVSPDGYKWTILTDPLLLCHTDTQLVAYYDVTLGKYVAYVRDWLVGPQGLSNPNAAFPSWILPARRCIGRSESNDFRKFSLSELVAGPRLDMTPSQVLYTNCYTTIPNAPDAHMMFPAVWDTASDTTFIEVMSSHDGKLWSYLSNSPVLETANFGEWDGGCVFASPNLIELPNGDWVLPYTGFNVPHKYPRVKATKSTGYAVWKKGRFSCIEAVEKGEFTTVGIVAKGAGIEINAKTKRAGSILVEVCDMQGNALPGRSFAESVPLCGDLFRKRVKWKEHDNLGVSAGDPVRLNIRMNQAEIYYMDFVD
jgi:hypothetical protein